MHVETDVCNEKPDPDLNCNDTTANDSAITKVFQVAIRNIGFVFAEVETLFNLMGSNLEFLKQVLEENLENAITFEKSESGYHQNPIDRDLGLTKSQNGETSFQRTCPRLQRNC